MNENKNKSQAGITQPDIAYNNGFSGKQYFGCVAVYSEDGRLHCDDFVSWCPGGSNTNDTKVRKELQN
jgi:hypothetical protein